MNIQEVILSYKYATAFLNLYIDKLSITDYDNIVRACAFLKKDQRLISCFKLPRVDAVKKKVIDVLFEQFELPSILKKLIDLLLKSQRLYLLPLVLESMQELYRQRKGIVAFNVISSSELTQDQLSAILSILEAKIGKQIEYKYKIDKALIAGVRLQSDNLLWEHSVAQQLAEARRLLSS